MLDKLQLRKSAIAKLKKIKENEKRAIEQKLKHYLTTSAAWENATTIGITVSQGFEWNTKPLIEEAWEQGKIVCVPKCEPKEKLLTFYQLKSYDQLEIVYYNLLEPKPKETKKVDKNDIDLLVVPGLVFAKNGIRIGFGGGYYDRYLTNFLNQTISLASIHQLVDSLPFESFDIPVNQLVTENGII
ncbi:5-formyltetrahydrofolate cyclo-ligase [Virgibacillus ndiopensis]|uniref:5-formyltetrahydrofolate cyclo-ligase n=1 Tax=Virgibacillus ndiopensis TaxID=2004408 RepID=UPI000C0747DE|nr:5-formyltetrahydrofolate cyclo-ligase [Virgibacillus ndiopensis]